MKQTIKKILKAFAAGLTLFLFLMLIPRFLALINPNSPPAGYHFRTLDLLAIGVGLESLVDLNPPLPADIEEIKNIEYKYINGKSLQFDIYRPKNLNKPAPLLVFIHGGGWRSGQRSDYKVYLIPFAQRGYVTATVSYRLLKDAPYPAAVEDVTDAVEWLYNNGTLYGCDTSRIALIGGSAGAHLAMLAGYGWKGSAGNPKAYPVKCVVDIYGPVDMTTEYARNHRLVTDFLARPYDESLELYKEASPATWIDSSDPPTLIFHGTSDKLVPLSQSVLLEKRLRESGVPVEFHKFPLWPHTMDIVKRVNIFCQMKMADFFQKYLLI